MKRREYRLGAAITPRHVAPKPRVAVQFHEGAVLNSHPDAYSLAMANRKKSWARRWLNAHRQYLRDNGLIEISL